MSTRMRDRKDRFENHERKSYFQLVEGKEKAARNRLAAKTASIWECVFLQFSHEGPSAVKNLCNKLPWVSREVTPVDSM